MSSELIKAALAELLDEYRQPHGDPWIVAFSAGKDSTLLLQLVVEMLLKVAPSERVRPVYVVSNDTLVENPMLATHQRRSLETIGRAADSLRLPLSVHMTEPATGQTFWANLIGRGYPPPNRRFRWCTDRMKIAPTSSFIKQKVSAAGKVVLLIGVRSAESSTRAKSVAKFGDERLNPHSDLKRCMVFRPIKHFATDEVWQILLQRPPPWGGTHRDLITLYRNAQAGECPLVIDRDQAPSCGTSSSRFGCWTCTVVTKDKSGEALAEADPTFQPLVDFRDWLVALGSDRSLRQLERRNGQICIMDNGEFMRGPFKPEVREMILARLLELQDQAAMKLISDDEISAIHRIWAEDALTTIRRRANGEVNLIDKRQTARGQLRLPMTSEADLEPLPPELAKHSANPSPVVDLSLDGGQHVS